MTAETPARVGLLLSDDLLFTSRITATGQSAGMRIKPARTPEILRALAEQETPSCVIVDLANPGLRIATLIQELRAKCSPMPRLIAYGSHVDTATLRSAREAGCDVVLPRSKFVEELATLLQS
jgi:DNA-binding NarL/FixJ family response regulator